MMMAVLRLSQAEADSNKIAGFTEKKRYNSNINVEKSGGFCLYSERWVRPSQRGNYSLFYAHLRPALISLNSAHLFDRFTGL